MKCEYEKVINQILRLAKDINNREPKCPIWKNGKLDTKIKNRVETILKQPTNN